MSVLSFATLAHAGQTRRDSGLPYITHPQNVANLVNEYYDDSLKNSKETLQAVALLHDVVEDTNFTLQDIEGEFGQIVANLVDELTTDNVKMLDKTTYLTIKLNRMSRDALFVKLCDRCDNIQDFSNSPDIQRARKYAQSTLEILAAVPLVNEFPAIVDKIKTICNKILQKEN